MQRVHVHVQWDPPHLQPIKFLDELRHGLIQLLRDLTIIIANLVRRCVNSTFPILMSLSLAHIELCATRICSFLSNIPVVYLYPHDVPQHKYAGKPWMNSRIDILHS